MKKHLKEIKDMFVNLFKEDLKKDFDGEVSTFKKFDKEFKEYFSDKFVKLKSLW